MFGSVLVPSPCCSSILTRSLLLLIILIIHLKGTEGNATGGNPVGLTKEEMMQRNCAYAKGLHPNLIRFVTKEGYHREIEDVVEVTFTNSILSPSDFDDDCKLALLAKFTRDVYIDPYEIQGMPSLSKVARVLNNWTDLEGPSWAAGSNSTIFVELRTNATGNLITTEQLKFPIHFRYQKPLSHSRFKERFHQNKAGSLVNPAGYVKVMVPLPRLLLRCESWNHALSEKKCHAVRAVCDARASKNPKDLCEWVSLPFKSNSKYGNFVFIPIGDTDQFWLVTGITILVILGGMVFLLLTFVRTKEKLERNRGTRNDTDDDDTGREIAEGNESIKDHVD